MSDESEAALTRTDSGLLRAVEAEARRRERIRIGDVLRRELARAEGIDPRTTEGRQRYGLERALDVIPAPDYTDGGPWTELIGSICAAVDGIDVALHLELDENGDADVMPYRLKVVDGCEDAVAYAYLNTGEVAELEGMLRFARTRFEEWLASRPVDNPPAAPPAS